MATLYINAMGTDSRAKYTFALTDWTKIIFTKFHIVPALNKNAIIIKKFKENKEWIWSEDEASI